MPRQQQRRPDPRNRIRTADSYQERMAKLKRSVQDFLGQDDQYWSQSIITLSDKFDIFMSKLKVLKEDLVVDKKMRYAFQWNDNLLYIAKQVLAAEYQKLSSRDINDIRQAVSKPRKIDSKQIQSLSKELVKDAEHKIKNLLQESFYLHLSKQKTANRHVQTNNKHFAKEDSKNITKKPKQSPKNQQKIKKRYSPKNKDLEKQKIQNRVQQKPAKMTSNQQKTQNTILNNLPQAKINEVKTFKDNECFNISFQVIQIKNSFYVYQNLSVRLLVKDSTGQIEAVIPKDPIIKQGASIKIYKAKKFNFKGTLQIQMSKTDSYIKEVAAIDFSEDRNYKKQTDTRYINNKNNKNNQKNTQKSSRPNRPQKEDNTRSRRQIYSSDEEYQKSSRPNRPPREDNRRPRNRPIYSSDEDQNQLQMQKGRQIQRYYQSNSRKQIQEDIQIKRQHRRHDRGEGGRQHKKEDPRIKKQQPQKINQNLPHKKIGQIQPGDDNFNILVQVVEKYRQNLTIKQKQMITWIVADQTAKVRLKISSNYTFVKQGSVIFLKDIEADVDKDNRITLRLHRQSHYQQIKAKIPKLNLEKDISLFEWIAQQQQDSIQETKQSAKKQKEIIWTQIQDISPDNQDINISAEVIRLLKVESPLKKNQGLIYYQIGDQTAIVRAELPQKYRFIKAGSAIDLHSANVDVDQDGHITIRLAKNGKCEESSRKFEYINTHQDMSLQDWEELNNSQRSNNNQDNAQDL